jgi:hypothetical protein
MMNGEKSVANLIIFSNRKDVISVPAFKVFVLNILKFYCALFGVDFFEFVLFMVHSAS